MKFSLGRTARVALVATAAVAATVALAGVAQAQPVDAGTVTFSGDEGDYITGGGSYAYDAGAGDALDVSASGNATVSVNVDGVNGDWWSLDFDAPNGQTLTPGTTYPATRYPFNQAGAGLSLSGNGRGCNTLSGSFTVVEASFGHNNYVHRFVATFEQHCEGGDSAARGEVRIENAPPPERLAIDAVTASGTFSKVSGNATPAGTVTCSEPVLIALSGKVSQVVNGVIVRGEFSTTVDCDPAAAAPWSATAEPSGTTPFKKGKAEVVLNGSAYDDTYSETVRDSSTTVVQLVRA